MITLQPEQIRRWVDINFDKVKVHKHGKELSVCNPFDGDTGFHLWINTDKGVCRDWRPSHQFGGKKGGISFLRLVQKMRGISFRQAVREVCGYDLDPRQMFIKRKKQLESIDEEVADEDETALPEGATPINIDKPYRNIIMAYLNRRKIDEDLAKSFNLHYTLSTIIFPYYEFEVLVYWQSRDISSKVYMFPPPMEGISKSQVLYGFDHIETDSDIYIVEGNMEVLTLGSDTAGIGGSLISEDQAKKMRLLRPKRIIWAMDNDNEGKVGIRKGYRVVKRFMPDVPQMFVLPPEEYNGKKVKDWNDMAKASSVEETRQYARSNIKLFNMSVLSSFMKRRSFRLSD
jgi:DNA primase